MWTAILTAGIQIVGFVLQYVAAKKNTVDAWKNFVDSAKADGLLSVQAADRFEALHEKLLARLNKPPAP